MALVLADTGTDLIKGIDEATSIRNWILGSRSSAAYSEDEILKKSEMGKMTLKGIGRLSFSTARLPLHLALAFCQGVHNLPSFWGDNNLRRIQPVENLSSGFLSAGKVRSLQIHS